MKKSKAELLKKIHGGQVCQLISTATRLKIFDYLYDSPQTAEDIGKELQIDPLLCLQFLHALEASYLLEENNGLFSLTEQGRYLSHKDEDSLADIAIYKGTKAVWMALGYLYDGIKENKTPFNLAFGKNIFEYLEENEEEFLYFHNAMHMYQTKSSKKILSLYDFTKFNSIADIGGGFGSFLQEILLHSPKSHGLIFDLPKVINRAKEMPYVDEIKPRLSFLPGSFFNEIPKKYDAYLLRNILHNWNDDKCIEILSNIKKEMLPHSKLLIFETLLSLDSKKRLGKFSNINMFTLTEGGKERTLKQIEKLLKKSGLQMIDYLQTTGSKALIEVKVVS